MLVAEYMVGSRRLDENKEEVICLVVSGDGLPADCQIGRSEIRRRLNRQDLILEFIENGVPVEWLELPGLPSSVVEILNTGVVLPVVDASTDNVVYCELQGLKAAHG